MIYISKPNDSVVLSMKFYVNLYIKKSTRM